MTDGPAGSTPALAKPTLFPTWRTALDEMNNIGSPLVYKTSETAFFRKFRNTREMGT